MKPIDDRKETIPEALKRLGVPEPTEIEKFIRRQEAETQRWLKRVDARAATFTAHTGDKESDQ